MGVKLKMDTLKSGKKSLYLDIYNNKNDFKRKSLNLYLIPEKDKKDKELNEQVLKMAKKVRNEYERNQLEEKLGLVDPKEAYDYSFLVYFERIVAQRFESGICYDTWRSVQMHLTAFSKGSIKFTQLTELFLEEFKTFLLKRVSSNTAGIYFNKIKRAIHQAYREGVIDKNPVYSVKPPKYEEPIREYLLVEDIRQLINVDYPRYKARSAFLFSCFTGLRFSDVSKLKWGNIKKKGEEYILDFRQEKTRQIEYLPMNHQALPFIGKRRQDDDLVFPNLKCSAWENVLLNKWMLKAGITKHITFHSARHTYATLLLNNGVDIYTVSKLLGHKDIKTTQIYAKLVDQSKIEAVAKIPEIT